MPKIQYETWDPKDSTKELADRCISIADRYATSGYDLSVRQLYYQLVAASVIPNTEKSYARIKTIVDRLRMAGLMDWYRIVDRTRHVGSNGHWDSPDQIIDSAADGYMIDHWAGQPRRVEVWVEKQALEGIAGEVARREDVAYFACRGYSSSSAMWRAAQRFLGYWRQGQAVTILHLGDHDPSGIDMTRDITDRLEHFLAVDWAGYRAHLGYDPLNVTMSQLRNDLEIKVGERPLEIRRIALNMDQIRTYNPPPNPAKVTDSRFAQYQGTYGDESWELDALEPTVLVDLIRREVRGERDDALYDARVERQEHEREILTDLTNRWDEVREYLENTPA